MSTYERPMEHAVYDAATLMKQHPQMLRNANSDGK